MLQSALIGMIWCCHNNPKQSIGHYRKFNFNLKSNKIYCYGLDNNSFSSKAYKLKVGNLTLTSLWDWNDLHNNLDKSIVNSNYSASKSAFLTTMNHHVLKLITIYAFM